MSVVRYSTEGSPTIGRMLVDDTSEVIGIEGPFGSGKSAGCVMKLGRLGAQMPPGSDGVRRSRMCVVRNTYGQLRDTTMRTLFEWFPPARFGTHYVADHRYVMDGFDGLEIEFLFRALDRPEHVQNLLSLELSHAWGNEARELPHEILGPLIGRLGRYPRIADVGQYKTALIMDTNPPPTEHWWVDLFEGKDGNPPQEGATLYLQPGGLAIGAENRRNLPDRYYEKMLGYMSPEEARVYIHGQRGYIRTGKAVYPEYNDQWHCREFEVKPRPVLRCWDFGLTPACVMLQVMPTGQVRVFDEVVADRAGIKAFAPVVQALCVERYPWMRQTTVRDVGDPAGNTPSQTDEESCFQIMRSEGIDIEPGVQDVVLRVESVSHLLRQAIDGEPALLLHPRCKRLRLGFQGEYQYRRLAVSGAEPRYSDKPDKNKYSHPHDAMQYGAVEIVGDAVRGLLMKPGRVQTHALGDEQPLARLSRRDRFDDAEQQEYAD